MAFPSPYWHEGELVREGLVPAAPGHGQRVPALPCLWLWLLPGTRVAVPWPPRRAPGSLHHPNGTSHPEMSQAPTQALKTPFLCKLGPKYHRENNWPKRKSWGETSQTQGSGCFPDVLATMLVTR